MSHVLLIEPDRVLAATYKEALVHAGFSVTPCASAQAAIFAADQLQPDLVIMELQLVEHSGVEFLYEFRSYPEWQSVPIIIHSQVPPAEFSGNLSGLKESLGVNFYLYKPLATLKDLLEVAHKYVKVAA